MTDHDRFGVARAIADAVLYEGYVLYPYRASARKNQVRWQFGVLAPRSFAEADGSERWSCRTRCLVDTGHGGGRLTVRIRCLQVQHRVVERLASGEGRWEPVDEARIGGARYLTWDEAVDQVVDLPAAPLDGGPAAGLSFVLPAGVDVELVSDGETTGRLVRRREQVEGRVEVRVEPVERHPSLRTVTVTVANTTDWSVPSTRRDDALAHSLLAVHTMLAVDGARFVSLLDPPAELAGPAAAAKAGNDGTFPVLVSPTDDVVLSSPIILYDHPEVAPESPGDLFDATEIDEILALRILTLTDEEKAEARATDARAARIVDRCDELPPEVWDRLHGALRWSEPGAGPRPGAGFDADWGDGRAAEPGAPPWWDPAADALVDPWSDSVWIAGVEVAKGTPVLLRPSHRADAQDLFVDGLTATVAGVFTDVDGGQHVAVTVDDDPATGELSWQGRYLFFHPDEVVPMGATR